MFFSSKIVTRKPFIWFEGRTGRGKTFWLAPDKVLAFGSILSFCFCFDLGFGNMHLPNSPTELWLQKVEFTEVLLLLLCNMQRLKNVFCSTTLCPKGKFANIFNESIHYIPDIHGNLDAISITSFFFTSLFWKLAKSWWIENRNTFKLENELLKGRRRVGIL